MPNIKSAAKRVETAHRNALRNSAVKSSVKTAIKKYEQALSEGDPEKTKASLINATRTIDKAAGQGVIHKNAAARKKSRLQRKLNALQG
ncbi:30S ribosomal protein S20 [Clostridiales bacterium PH28_bin88]|nr:30S ribosomal protein S20 [Clostridiales bacterium PH28_bin88]